MSLIKSILSKIGALENGLRISTDVTAIDGICVSRKGDTIDQEYLKRLERIHLGKGSREVRLVGTEVFNHLSRVLDQDKYRFIIQSGADRNQLMDQLADVRINEMILKELAWLKRLDYHYHHSLVVVLMMTRIMREIATDARSERAALLGAFTHDLGISRIPPAILLKVSALDHSELSIIREHPLYSYLLLTYYLMDHEHPVALAGLSHHEDQQGQGYPRGIETSNTISQYIQLCDIYDALLSDRPFRPALNREQAMKVLSNRAEDQLIAPDVFATFVKCFS